MSFDSFVLHPSGAKRSVWAESEQVVAGDRLGLAGLAHEELWPNGHRLQIDRERQNICVKCGMH